MDIGEFFRSFFGLRGAEPRQDHYFPFNFNDAPEQHQGQSGDNDVGDNDDDCPGTRSEFPFFFGHGGRNLDDMYHHFHKDMNKQMEFLHREMEEMIKGFGTIDSSKSLPPIDKPESNDTNTGGHSWFFDFGTPPIPGSGTDKKYPRDFMLKEDSKTPETSPPISSPSDRDSHFFDSRSFGFRNPFSQWGPSSQDQGKDTDLDGTVSSSDAMDLIRRSDGGQSQGHAQPSKSFFSGTSVTVTSVRSPEGKVEQTKIVRDDSGREESTVSRSLDGISHTVTTIKGPDGVEQTREDFKNMNENDIQKFEEMWRSYIPLPQPPSSPPKLQPSPRLDPRDMDLFSRFFKGS